MHESAESENDAASPGPQAMSKATQAVGLIAWLVVCYATSAIGAVGSMSAPTFYKELALPTWAPPAWLFGPVWTILYGLMGIAAWLVWRKGGFAINKIPLSLFLVQLGFNAIWSWLFFAWHLGAVSFIEILLLWLLIAATTAAFWRVQKVAAGLLVPYLAWVTFAAALNFAIWQLNPSVLG